MKKARYAFVIILSVFMLAVVVWPAAAQTAGPVTAQVDRSSLTTDDRLTLIVTIDSSLGDASQPTLPALDDFQMLGSSRGSQMSIVNGQTSSQTVYQFTLQPTRPGDLVIGPIAIVAGGNSYETNPIAVRVSQGNGQPSAPNQPSTGFPSLPGFPSFGTLGSLGPLGNLGNFGNLGNLGSLLAPPAAPSVPTVPIDPAPVPAELAGQALFLEAVVDNQTPYQGQQVLYKIRLYRAVENLGSIEYRAPSFTGFWSEQLPEQGEYMIQAAGRDYRVTELTTVLFPTVVGQVTIDPATMDIPADFFSQGASLASQPLMLDVQPLPDTAPPGFQGAVGRLEIEASVDKSETRVNDTVNWRVVLSGQGNIENLPDPVWEENQSWRAFDSQATVDSRFADGKFGGSRTLDRLLVPTEAGQLTLPAVTYSYFDPDLGDYVTIESQPLPVNVTPNGNNASSPVTTLPAGSVGASEPTGAAPLAEIRPMKEAPDTWTTGNPWITDRAGFWLLWAIPLLLLAGHFGWERRQSRRLSNLSLRRSKQAAGKAQQALKRIRKGPAEEIYHACGQILTTYLSEKLDRSLTGKTQAGVARLLREQGVESELAVRVERCLILSEMGRYAPADLVQPGDDLMAETGQIIGELDKVL